MTVLINLTKPSPGHIEFLPVYFGALGNIKMLLMGGDPGLGHFYPDVDDGKPSSFMSGGIATGELTWGFGSEQLADIC